MAKLATTTPSKEILEIALRGLESQRAKLDEQIGQVRAMMGTRRGRPAKSAAPAAASPAAAVSAPSNGRRKRVLTAEARKRIAAAQKKRWAEFRKNQG